MYWCRVFTAKDDFVIAACDQELLDKEIKNEEFDLKISRNFYGGALVEERILVKLIKKATIGNFFGNRVVDLAKKNGFIEGENVISIDGIAHAQFIKIEK